MGQPRSLFRLFKVFSNKQYNFYNKSMQKMSKCPSIIARRDSNRQSFEQNLSPITTRPGLQPNKCFDYLRFRYRTLFARRSFKWITIGSEKLLCPEFKISIHSGSFHYNLVKTISHTFHYLNSGSILLQPSNLDDDDQACHWQGGRNPQLNPSR